MPIATEVNGERLVVLGWPRAILMQMAHPLVAAGVADHSSFRDGPVVAVRRLHATVQAMLALTFGTAEHQREVIEGIRAIHRRVHGTLRSPVGRFPAGTPYSAEDPELVRWVHLTLLDSSVLAYERLVGPLAAADRDAYCAEAQPVAVALGADPARIPVRWEQAVAAVDAVLTSGQLHAGADARAIAHAVLDSAVATAAGPVGWATRRLTMGWLPRQVVSLYDLDGRVPDPRRLHRLERTVRRVRAALPRRLARWAEQAG